MNLSQSSSLDHHVAAATAIDEDDLGRMIRNLESAHLSSITRHSSHSSLGRLSSLPAEILVMILQYLDFQSLSRLSRASLRGKEVVEGLPAYQQMMQHAPKTLTALGKTGLMRYHSMALLHQTLRSDKCVSCNLFGGFLLLPTCQRVCFECLDRNTALRMMRLDDAKLIFGVTLKQLRRIPIMKTIPAKYFMRSSSNNLKKPFRLVNVGQAKELALKIHGSIHALEQFAPCRWPTSEREYRLTSFLHAPIEMPGSDMSKIWRQRFQVKDWFGGAATIRFPYLASEGVDFGRLCRGCEVTFEHYHRGILPERIAIELLAPKAYPAAPLLAALSRLRAEPEHVAHVRHCYGVARLLAKSDRGTHDF